MNDSTGQRWRMAGLLASLGLAVASHFAWQSRHVAEPVAIAPAPAVPVPKALGFDQRPIAITRGDTIQVHSASAIELPNGDLRCYWFGGTREGHRDVSIWSSRWDHVSGTWDAPVVSLERRWLEQETGLNLRKLGNPVAFLRGDSVELFVVGVSMGGWSGSAVYHLVSTDQGRTFSDPRRLNVSPFLNISTLVRYGAHPSADGDGVIVPCYHEFVVKYPCWIRLNENRQVSMFSSAQQAKGFLQPSQISAEGTPITFLRDTHEEGAVHVLRKTEQSSGNLKLARLPIPNPNSAVAALALEGGILLACNDSPSERDRLSLLYQDYDSLDAPWRMIREVETPEKAPDEQDIDDPRYSYPWLMQTSDGVLHLFYTWNRSEIRHLRFDARDWPDPQQPETP